LHSIVINLISHIDKIPQIKNLKMLLIIK